MLTCAVNSTVLPENLTGPQLFKKFPAVYGTRRFITASQMHASRPYPLPDQSSPIYFLKIHYNINLPSTPRSSKWFSVPRFPHQTPVRTSSLPYTCYMPCPYSKRYIMSCNNVLPLPLWTPKPSFRTPDQPCLH